MPTEKKTLSDKLLDILKEKKLISEDQLKRVLDIRKKAGGSLGKILIKENIITHKDLVIFLSEELHIPPLDLSKYKIDPKIAKLVPEKIALRHNLIPISKIANTLTIAMSDPTDVLAIDDVKTILSRNADNIEVIIAADNDIKDALGKIYGAPTEDMAKIVKDAGTESVEVVEEEKLDVGEITEESQKAPIVKIVSLILNEALRGRASDIHIEPCEKDLRVRYRIDGALQEALRLPKKNQNAVIARLKIMSKLDITETRVPQDGRFRIKLGQKEIDFRVSILPIAFGNKVVLRALDKSNLSIGLEKLGFLREPLKAFKKALERPFGMILLTGPTGSGKSTTLYSIVNNLNTPKVNIVTIEEPVEYEVEGITQIQVNPDIGLTFASGLRSILRQNPDIIMIGEIRDFETADIAIKASLTGQLVLSTLHTNDAIGAITRLIDMGVEPFLVSASLVLTAAQRLCRKICPRCKEPIDIPRSVFERIGGGVDIDKLMKRRPFYHGKGCPRCNNTGYLGRMGLLETLTIDDTIRDMIIKRVSSDEIRKYALSQGMMLLRDSALENFASGQTTLEEVLRITTED
ncbi:MAG: Flp pilus assembly complex ATPase component TadA [Candidatus Omnitrophica bacterium]|nr:Flp pilus assembly complex ATPase component TadA [Candidatus Omnitrophota bacterium]